ncbi:MAG: hypothetical protein ULS35scaffold63_48 [Phage 33_17]|nr:MAG: hypothetical protein ULS35scaffold63_48 [Phage 33_17]
MTLVVAAKKEDKIQIQFGQLINKYAALNKLNSVWWTYMPLGEYRLPSTASMLKKKGVKAGMADYLFIKSKDNFLYLVWIEFKTDIGKQNPNQILFQNRINNYQNSVYLIARSVADAVKFLEKYEVLITS